MMKLDYTDEEVIELESIIVDYHRIYEKLRTLGLLPIAKIHDIHKFNEICRLRDKQMLTMKKRYQYAEDCLEDFWKRPKATTSEFREEFEDDKKLVKQICELVKSLKVA